MTAKLEVNVVKWRSLLAILLGLFVLGATGNVEAKKFHENPIKVAKVEGIYDPTPQRDKLGVGASTAVGSFVFDTSKHKVRGTIKYSNKEVVVDWDFSAFKSTKFDGYAFFFNATHSEDVVGLEAVVYKNGTVWVFAREKNGGIIALEGFSKNLVKSLSNMNVPSSGVSDKEWLWMTLEPEVKTVQAQQIAVPNAGSDKILPMATHSTEVTKIVEMQYSVGWWIWETTYYIKVALKLRGPTSLENYGDYNAVVIVLDEGEISNGERISKNTPLFLGDRADSVTEPIEVGLWVPQSPKDHIIKAEFTYSGVTPSSPEEISLGWDLLTDEVNPIDIVEFLLNLEPSVEFENFSDPVNSIHAAYRNIALDKPGHWTKALTHVEHDSGTGYGTIVAFFKVPVYYQVSATQSLRSVGIIDDKVEIRAWHS